MNDRLNINTYKKQKKRKKLIRCIKWLIVAFGLCLLGIFIWVLLIKPQFYKDNSTGLLVSLSGDPIVDCTNSESKIVVLTNKELIFYSDKGTKLRTINHSAISPVINNCGDYIMLYEQGGTNYSIENSNNTILSETVENKIMLGKIAENGNIAIVTEDERYACSLTVYDKSANQIFKWNLAENLIVDLQFTNKGKGCVVATIGASEGFTKGVVYGLNFSQSRELFKTDIENSMPISIGLEGGYIHTVCDNKMVVMDKNGSKIKDIIYTQKLKQYVTTQNNYTVLLFGEEVKFNCNIVVYDKLGSIIGQIESNNNIRCIKSDGNNVLVLSDNSVICYNMKLETLSTHENKQSAVKLVYIGAFGYDISQNQINKFYIY